MAKALAKNQHIVYAGMYSHDGSTAPYEKDCSSFAKQHSADLRTVGLDLTKTGSTQGAVDTILAQAGHLDTVIHNAGHMSYGPSEAFTPEQLTRLYEINVVGAHRLNLAILPHWRKARKGHLIWISSSSVAGGKSPMLGPYFAAKSAMDTLAVVQATELNPWGIETTIISPGVFTKGTNHFIDASKPGYPAIADEYEASDAPSKGIGEETMAGTAGVVPEDADPSMVADAVVDLANKPRGQKPLRMVVDTAGDGSEEGYQALDRSRDLFYKKLGLEKYLNVRLN